MRQLRSYLFRPRMAQEPSPRERVLAQRERLLLCALQILGDPQAALEIVLLALGQALRSPLLVQLSGALPAAVHGSAPAEPEALSRWLDRLIVNLALTRLRAVPVGEQPREDGEPPLSEVLRRPAPSPADERPRPPPAWPAGDLQQLPRLAQHLARLSPEVRIALTLCVMQGRTVAEAADILGCGEATCRFWLTHGRKELRRALQNDLSAESVPPEPRAPVPVGAAHELRRGKKTAARA